MRTNKKSVWLTDIHLDFASKKAIGELIRQIKKENPSEIIITGDIAEAHSFESVMEPFTKLSCPVYFSLGNHDYYGSSITAVRQKVKKITLEDNNLFWLSARGVVPLVYAEDEEDSLCLIGVDGWGDSLLGTPMSDSCPVLSDWEYINDFRETRLHSFYFNKPPLLSKLRELGRKEAVRAERLLRRALSEGYTNIIFATHVPPWEEATWHNGSHSSPEWLPFFSCGAVGDVLVQVMAENPDRNLVVLCGHTHGEGVSNIAPNIIAYTGAAEYRLPTIVGTISYNCLEAPLEIKRSKDEVYY